MNPDRTRDLSFLMMVGIVAVFVAVTMSGCAHQRTPASEVSTAALSGHLDRIDSNLSAVDAKAVVVEQWLKTHR